MTDVAEVESTELENEASGVSTVPDIAPEPEQKEEGGAMDSKADKVEGSTDTVQQQEQVASLDDNEKVVQVQEENTESVQRQEKQDISEHLPDTETVEDDIDTSQPQTPPPTEQPSHVEEGNGHSLNGSTRVEQQSAQDGGVDDSEGEKHLERVGDEPGNVSSNDPGEGDSGAAGGNRSGESVDPAKRDASLTNEDGGQPVEEIGNVGGAKEDSDDDDSYATAEGEEEEKESGEEDSRKPQRRRRGREDDSEQSEDEEEEEEEEETKENEDDNNGELNLP